MATPDILWSIRMAETKIPVTKGTQRRRLIGLIADAKSAYADLEQAPLYSDDFRFDAAIGRCCRASQALADFAGPIPA